MLAKLGNAKADRIVADTNVAVKKLFDFFMVISNPFMRSGWISPYLTYKVII